MPIDAKATWPNAFNYELGWEERNEPDYKDIVAKFGAVLVEHSAGSYQGDSFFVIRDGCRLGVLIFGWGSCSGCDALQACSSLDELQKLCDSLESSIVWVDTLEGMLRWREDRNEANDFWMRDDEGREFVVKVDAFLAKEAA